MEIKIEKIKFTSGKELEVMRQNLATGKKILKSNGYEQCPNDLFMQKENSIVHYNKNMKVWIFE